MITELTQEEKNSIVAEYLNNDSLDTSSFLTEKFNDGITPIIDEETVTNWLANPETNIKEIENILTFYYMSNPDVFQLYDMANILPTLNYKLQTYGKKDAKKYETNMQICKKALKITKHKQLTRDLVTQTTASGTLCGIWVGTKKNPYLFIFNDLEYVFPAYRQNGNWAIWLDMAWLETMSESQRATMFDNLSPHLTLGDYKKYEIDSDKYRYIEFPIEYSVCIRTHTLFRNQRLGIPWGTQSIFNILHKQKLKDLEKSISNKVINSVAVLTYGLDEKNNPSYQYTKIAGKKNKVYYGVKSALQKNEKQGVTIVGVPNWVKLDFPDIKTDGLNPEKFNSIDADLNTASNGVNNVINGKSNYSSGKLTLDIMYKKVGVLLEQIEEEVYQKLFNWILKVEDRDNYSIEYDKQTPLSTKEKVLILEKLNATFGFSLKDLVDQIDGIDFDEYVKQSIYEQQTLKLPEKIQPYANAYTQNGKGSSGASETDDANNPATEQTKTDDGNSNPKPSTE